MKRDLARLADRVYDVAIIGGGAYGLFTAWDAALRGLSVALVERGDFGQATSYNSLRVIHGGLRYLQSGDLCRMRVSIRERTNFMAMAPHLVHPLPVLIPTYGHGMRGRELMALALEVHDLVGFDRNRLNDPQKRLPPSRVVSREECLGLCPGIDQRGLSGAALLYDGQMYSSERLLISLLRSAAKAGADLVNYTEVTGFLSDENGVKGVKARDLLGGGEVAIRARVVVNTGGPWVSQLCNLLDTRWANPRPALSKAFNLVVNRQLVPEYSFGVYSRGSHQGKYQESRYQGQQANIQEAITREAITQEAITQEAIISKASRIFFATPWHGVSLIGTEHLPYHGEPDNFQVTEEEVCRFVEDFNAAFEPANLSRQDVTAVYGGMLSADGFKEDNVRLTKSYRVRDHSREGGPQGLVSASGVKFTESRHVAEKVVDLLLRKLGRTVSGSQTSVTPVYGGNIDQFKTYLDYQMKRGLKGLSAEAIERLVYLYGSAYPEVLEYLDDRDGDASAADATENLRVLQAEVAHAVHREMAQKLSDVVFRRAVLGMTGPPPDVQLEHCARAMAAALGWDMARTRQELAEAKAGARSAGTPALITESPVEPVTQETS
ncbi:MAG TPA: glycerol-3-phosphate dehydrogenase/oxidase [Dehalococcoidia bacterium]|nr:glycerol-3-phosphate dehydrogenase/oxidase [Dehalococcoidia bacterium]